MDEILKQILIILGTLLGLGSASGSAISYNKYKKENKKQKKEMEKIRNDFTIQNNQVNELKLTIIQLNNKLDIITNYINLMISNNSSKVNINKTINETSEKNKEEI